MIGTALIVLEDALHEKSDIIQNAIQRLSKCKGYLNSIDVLLEKKIECSGELNYVLTEVYSEVRATSQQYGWTYKLNINVFFNKTVDFVNTNKWDCIFCEGTGASYLTREVEDKCSHLEVQKKKRRLNLERGFKVSSFRTCAVGGTFDHLHDGHKVLLSMAAFLSQERLIIGITDQELLKAKKYASALEPFSIRQSSVARFLSQTLSKETRFEIYRINDVCGPTSRIKEIDTLIVSDETQDGGTYVNKVRREQDFPELTIVRVSVIGDGAASANNKWAGKISSTDIRKLIANAVEK